MKRLKLPLNDTAIANLKTGEHILLSGVIYTAHDAAHRMSEALDREETLFHSILRGRSFINLNCHDNGMCHPRI